jgi:hypothetical protein
MGLPTSGALPYQTYASTITTPSITAITAAPSSGNQLAIASNDLVYASVNSGATFAPTGLGQNNNPFIYIPFDGSVTDVMGNSTVTATGSITYVTGKVGAQSVNINNSATVGLVANQYLTGTWTGATNFTISFWFNSQSPPTTGQYQSLFVAYQNTVFIGLGTAGQIYANMPSGGGSSAVTLAGTSFTISQNTWYNAVYVFQRNGLCSFYINNTLIASVTNTGGTGTTTNSAYTIGAQNNTLAFNGYICDFRLYNYAVTNPSGAALINPLVGPIMPFVYLTFDGSTITDIMGNSTLTTTGSPGFVVGQVGPNAVNLANTAGGTATRYIRGTLSSSRNITISFWINPQTISSVYQYIFSMYSGAIQIFISNTNVINCVFPTGTTTGQTVVSTSYVAVVNTWYYITAIFQTNGLCSLYVNNVLAGTMTNGVGGYGTFTQNNTFGLGTYDNAQTNCFNGYIDDFRIYNDAFLPSTLNPALNSPSYAIGLPNIYLPFENVSVLDVLGYSAVSARGTMNFVPGVVGSTALNLVNPAGGTAVNYIIGSWAGSANFTMSFWFNTQTMGANQLICGSYNTLTSVFINSSNNQLTLYLPTSPSVNVLAITGPTITSNTWYQVTVIFQTGGVCSFYVNNTLYGTYTHSGSLPICTQFCLGTYGNNSLTYAFNGYIDDFKLYNCAVPFNSLAPMNYTQATLSNTGAYQVVTAANGGVYVSANSGSSWSQPATSPAAAAAVNTVGGQVITPQLTGLAAGSSPTVSTTWIQNGVSWVASASSNNGSTQSPHKAFNNTPGDAWLSDNVTQRYTMAGITNGNTSTTSVIGVGTVTGEYLQIQSSVPVVMNSFAIGLGLNPSPGNAPKTYYIIGSNDGTNWYTLQTGTTNITTLAGSSGFIIINQTGTQLLSGTSSGNIVTVAAINATNSYTYFRLIGTSIINGGGSSYMEIGEWYINFTTPATPLYVAPSTALIANQSVSAITVMPQQTGLVSNTWTTNGMAWTSSASTVFAVGTEVYRAFNNTTGANAFYTGNFYNGNTGAYTGSISTSISGLSAATGEWLQIQSSAPLVMSSYTFACTGWWQLAKTGFIVGSTDGTTWFPIQSFTMTINPFTANYLTASNYITIGPSGTQTQAIYGNQTGSGSFTGYSTSSNAYTYFRFIASTIWGASTNVNSSNNDGFGPSEWFINFTAYVPALLQALTVSPTGQYMVLTGAGATTPNLTGLATSTWAANGVSWTASASSVFNSSYPASDGFNNICNSTGWASVVMYNTTTGALNAGSPSTTIQNIGDVSGEWLQIQSSVPLAISSYTYGTGGAVNQLPKTYYIVGSTDNTTWYPIQYALGTTNPCTVIGQSCSTFITIMNQNGVQTIQGGQTGSYTTTVYPTSANSYLYFRFIVTSIWPTNNGSAQLGEWYINFQSGPTFYSTDYGSSWTRALTATTMPNTNVLATSGNGQYSLQGCRQTVTLVSNTLVGYSTGTYMTPTFSPALSSAVGPVINAALSATGQYMVILIQSTTNNVYYSTNYGVSFTGLTVGSSSMVSCAISADGTYITVANVAQVYTLNRNIQGYSVSIGNAAGVVNQGQNAIAIGNQAGVTNQPAGSIILNSSGSTLDAYTSGFYVSNIADYGTSYSPSFSLLAYGSDSQIVKWSGISVAPTSYVGIGTTAPSSLLHVSGGNVTVNYGSMICLHATYAAGGSYSIGGTALNLRIALNSDTVARRLLDIGYYTGDVPTGAWNSKMVVDPISGNVGISTTSPSYPLHVIGAINCSSFLVNGVAVATGTGSVWGVNGSSAYYTSGNVGIGTTTPITRFTIRNRYDEGDGAGLCIDSQDGNTYNLRLSSFTPAGGQVNYRFGVNNISLSNPNTLVFGYNGYVGVGTSVPSNVFHVYAPQATAWPVLINYSSGIQIVMGNGGSSSNFMMDTYNSTTGGRPALCFNNSGGWIGLGSGAPSSYCTIGNGASHPTYNGINWTCFNTSTGAAYFAAYDGTRQVFLGVDSSGYGMTGTLTNHDFVIRVNNGERVRFATSGNVGIGTQTVRRTLDVVGTPSYPYPHTPTQLSLSDTVNSALMNLLIGVNGTNNYASIQSSLSGTGTTPLLLNGSGGYVGIGTTNPTSQIHLHGTVGSGYWSNSCLRITNGISTTDGATANGSSIQLQNGYNAYYFNIMTYGYSGGSNSAFYIHSDNTIGVVLYRGSNTWATYSDSRMKIDVTPLPSELSNILKLNPVSYLYDTDPTNNVHIVERVGFLADEVFDIYPNLVTKDSGMPYTNQAGETFIPMTMCMTDLIPYHTKAIQELASQATSHATHVQELTEKNSALEVKNSELTQKIDTLSASYDRLLAWAQSQGFVA